MAINGSSTAPPPAPERPSQTLYCSNLNDRLQKADLKRELYMLFSTYGTILDIVALKTDKMRGQAHILFRDVQASIQAMRALQGFEFFGKQMKIAYAKTKSDTLAKLDGTYRQPIADPTLTVGTSEQRSIFAGPPGTNPITAIGTTAAVSGTTAASDESAQVAEPSETAQVAGVKRTREESEAAEEDGDDAPMDMDDDGDAAMDESD